MPKQISHVMIPITLVNKVLQNFSTQPLGSILELYGELKQAADQSLTEQQNAPEPDATPTGPKAV